MTLKKILVIFSKHHANKSKEVAFYHCLNVINASANFQQNQFAQICLDDEKNEKIES